MNAFLSQLITLKAYIHSMFRSMFWEEMQNSVQMVNELKAKMAQTIKQYQPRRASTTSKIMDAVIQYSCSTFLDET